MSSATAGVGRVEHLIRSSPLDQWPAKARRLSAVIPMFRADNARLRGMDSASILSFRQPPPLDLPTFEAEKAFQMIAKHLQTSPVPPSQRTDQPVGATCA